MGPVTVETLRQIAALQGYAWSDERLGSAVGEDAAGEELAELLLHELGQTGAIGTVGRFAKKGLQVDTDDGVEDAALRVAWAVGRALWGHEPQVGPESVPSQCRKGDTPNGLGTTSGEPLPVGGLFSGTALVERFVLLNHAVLLAGGTGKRKRRGGD